MLGGDHHLFNVLVTSAPKELAGDVGSLRGVTQNLAAAVGVAVIGTLVVGVLSTGILLARPERQPVAQPGPSSLSLIAATP